MLKRKNKNISYGIISYKLINNIPYYCLVCRKDSFCYSEFIRGKYVLEDIDSIYRIFKYMTISEKEKIISNHFDILWDDLWILDKKKIYSGKFKKEFIQSKYKFDTLKRGYFTTIHTDLGIRSKKFIKLNNILQELSLQNESYLEPEWGFPKGKKNENESTFDCAKREFEEETNISPNILIFSNNTPIIENFIADNLQEYTHIYYIAMCPSNVNLFFDKTNYNQLSEISSIGWFSYEDVLSKIRNYSIEKKNAITIAHNLILKSLT